MYDVVIIGAGVSGCSIARELSKYQVKACVIDKDEDVCEGTSKANSAIVHAGFDAAVGSLMAKLNVQGNEMMDQIAKDLDVPFKRNGSLVVCTDAEDLPKLEELRDRGIANGVKDIQILNRQEALAIEPNLSDKVVGAMFAPTGGIVCPFNLTIAFAENAYNNGVEFRLNTEVKMVSKKENGYVIETSQGNIETKCVVNAAGVYADVIHNMVSEKKITIIPRRGDYCLLDKAVGNHISHTVFQLPGKYGKGVLVSPTIHGNLLVGPTAIDIEDKDGTNTTAEGLKELTDKAGEAVKDIPMRQVITSFAGLRAHEAGHEFIIGEVEDAKGFVDVAGIESPGLSSAPAIGVMVGDIVRDLLHLEKKDNFIATRKGIVHMDKLSLEERNEMIKKQPAYGNIICRCEMISEGEILDAIHRPLGAKSLDAVKRRTRAGMGRCQAGFCSPRTMEILSREWNMPQEEITKAGGNSKIVLGHTKEDI